MARDEQLCYGAGGKALRRLRFGRMRGGLYDRPLSGRHAPPELRAAADPRRQSWLSKIVDPPARILKDTASWFLSSLFGNSLPAIGPAPEDDSEANETNDIQENEEPETEELYHGRDPAYNSQTSKLLEFQDAFELPDDAGASPAEIAKAYRGGRSQRAPNCLGIQKKPLLNENTPERCVGISSLRRAGPLLIGNGEIDERTPRNFKFDSRLSNFSRTRYGRSAHIQKYPAIVAASPSSSLRTPLNTPVQVESEAKNSLKRRSCVLLEDGITSSRRIRRKLHNRNSENTFRTPENNEVQISARGTRVPPQSSEAARKILEKLEEKMVPLPKEKLEEKMVPLPNDNPDALLAIALDKSPLKVTSNMLKGPARRRTQSLAALPFERQMILSAERPEQSNIQNIFDKNKGKGTSVIVYMILPHCGVE